MTSQYDRVCTLEPWRNAAGRYGIVTLYSIVTPAGTQEKLVPTATGEAISRSGWRLTCSGGESGTRTLQSPDGRKYVMDVHVAAADMESYDNVQTKQRWSFLPSRVEDVHGNSLVYGYTGLGANGKYFGHSPDVRVSAPFLTSITSSDVHYDALGRKTFQSVAGFPTVGHAFQYDGLNRLVGILHNADNSSRTFTFGAAGGVPTLAVQDERGHVTTHDYRAYGDPDKTLLMNIAAPIASASVAIQRNSRGLVTSATQAGIRRTFGYDSRQYLASATHPEVGTVIYGRDDAGNMTSKSVGKGATTQYEYDGRNRLWRVTYPGGSPSQVVNRYWRTDKLLSVDNAVARRTYAYDANQNLTHETLIVDGLTMAAAYEHDGNDRLESIAG